MGTLSIVWAIARKDLTLEYRNREVVISITAFALLVLSVFVFSVSLTPAIARVVAPGILWVAVAFAGVTGLNRAFSAEMERDTLDGLMLAPVSRDLLFLGKALGSFLFMGAALLVIVPVYVALYNLTALSLEMFLISVLAVGGFSMIGTLAAAMSVRVRAREVMLPMLFLPVIAPLLMAAVETTGAVANGRGWGDSGKWIGLAAGFDLVFLVLTAALFPSVLEE